MATDHAHIYIMPLFVPPSLSSDARYWTRIAPDWQQDIADDLEVWLRAPDDSYDPLNRKDVDGAIRDYLTMGAITSMQGRHLRSVWLNMQEKVS